MAPKYQVTVPPHHGECIEAWAEMEGRQLSSLCALLIELGLAAAEQQKMMPQSIADRLRFRLK